MGLQVGQMFAPLIARHVAAWLQHVSEETGCTHDAALATAATFSAPIQEHKACHNILYPGAKVSRLTRTPPIFRDLSHSTLAIFPATG